jgi:asparagine synthase (glutamine-hydrolysing)
MCGIFGIVDLGGAKGFDEARFATALETLHHRGPDARGQQRLGDVAILGHTRLSIIDLSDSSNQPMVLAERYWLTYNGEIFNYLEIREKLEAEGVVFHTTGDVEVLLQAYARWGKDCVSRFNGMWAFAIYDLKEQTLFCSRDRFGIKPFNYAINDGQLLFASEIKAMLSYAPSLIEPDYNVISNFCRTSVGAQHEESWFKRVKRLQPGCNLIIRDGRMTIERYWNYPEQIDSSLSETEAQGRFRDLFDDAVRIRMRSDVPLGLTLSAGVDSNSIAYLMQRIDPAPHHSFTARFNATENLKQDKAIFKDGDTAVDESVVACKTAAALGLEPHVVETDYQAFVESVTRIIYHLESGNSAPAVIPLMQLLARARQKLTVVMEGQGADELLAGYIVSLLWPSVFDLLKGGKVRQAWGAIAEFSKTYTISHSLMMLVRSMGNRLPFIDGIYQRANGINAVFGSKLDHYRRMADYPAYANEGGGGFVRQQLRRQHAGGLVNLLHYGDAISMANSLESRMPFLDHRLVEFAWPLPAQFKISHGVGKQLLRRAMRGIVPDEVLDNRIKYGFITPVGEQFRKSMSGDDGPLDILLSERCLKRGLFDRDGLAALIEAHRSAKRDHGPLLFRLLSTELWFRVFVDPAEKAGT